MKTLLFTISHANLAALMSQGCLARILKLEDLGHERGHYIITARVPEQYQDEVIRRSADHPRWVKWD
jgi:hypothetical protein